jgi:hypothetical protein
MAVSAGRWVVVSLPTPAGIPSVSGVFWLQATARAAATASGKAFRKRIVFLPCMMSHLSGARQHASPAATVL